MKRTINIRKSELISLVNEALLSFKEETALPLLKEGMTIDYSTKTVRFDPGNQDNVDTNDYLHPYIIENKCAGCSIVSIFERKNETNRNDGNPVIYALKGINGWRFSDPSHDIPILYRHFLSATTCLRREFDTMIMTPSNNKFNEFVFDHLKKYINCKNFYKKFFKKLSAKTVEEFYMRWDVLAHIARRCSMTIEEAREKVEEAFQRMEETNGGIFSYKYLPKVPFRQLITQSLQVSFEITELEHYQETINGKEVIVLDDTVTSGKTISDSADAIREMFDPKHITFVTVFSPLKRKKVFPNNRISEFK